jgi:hypothetical protein
MPNFLFPSHALLARIRGFNAFTCPGGEIN